MRKNDMDKVYNNTHVYYISWGSGLPTTRWGRLKLKARVMRSRARDAWLVLTGKAETE